MIGQIGILNVGAGDTKLVFDKNNPEDCARAARTVSDMIRRGYVILVEVAKDDKGESLYRRIKEFREDTCEYIIAGDVDISSAETIDEQSSGAASAASSRKKILKTHRVHASAASGIAVSRTAGG